MKRFCKMKVMIVSKNFWPVVGGIEKLTFDLSKKLGESASVTVLTSPQEKIGCFVKTAGLGNFFQVFEKIKKEKPNIIHLHGFRAFGLWVWLSGKILRIPVNFIN